MIILKSSVFSSPDKLTQFVNENNIKKEDILSITNTFADVARDQYTLFFYSDSATEMITHGWFS